jgi:CRISPR-associated protein Cas5 subtype I-B
MELYIKIFVKHFSYRNPLFLTSSPTYPIVPPTSIYGLFASLLGIGKNDVKENRKLIKKEVQDKIKEIKILVIKEFKGRPFGIMRWNADRSKWGENWFTPITHFYLFDLDLIVFINCEEDLRRNLCEKIKNHESDFTPYLGSSENLIKSISLINKDEIDFSQYMEIKPIESVTSLQKSEELIRIKMPSKYDDEGNWIFEDWIATFRIN